MSHFNCSICFSESASAENVVRCTRCRSSVCTECFRQYVEHCRSEMNKLPVCVMCAQSVTPACFSNAKVMNVFISYLLHYLQRNPQFMRTLNKSQNTKNIIEKMRNDKLFAMEQMPAAIRTIINVALSSKRKEIMKLNMKRINALVNAVKPCFSSICAKGVLTRHEEQNTFECDTCFSYFCITCEKRLSPKSTAVHVCAREDIESQEALKTQFLHCPTCDIPVQKISGCSHLQCAVCGTHFDEVTGQIMSLGSGLSIKDAVPSQVKNNYTLVHQLSSADEVVYSFDLMNRIKLFQSSEPPAQDGDVLFTMFEELVRDEEGEDVRGVSFSSTTVICKTIWRAGKYSMKKSMRSWNFIETRI